MQTPLVPALQLAVLLPFVLDWRSIAATPAFSNPAFFFTFVPIFPLLHFQSPRPSHQTLAYGGDAFIVLATVHTVMLQVMSSESGGSNKASRNATVTSMIVCCGFVVCWTSNQIYYFLSLIGYSVDLNWFYHSNTVAALQAQFLINIF